MNLREEWPSWTSKLPKMISSIVSIILSILVVQACPPKREVVLRALTMSRCLAAPSLGANRAGKRLGRAVFVVKAHYRRGSTYSTSLEVGLSTRYDV